MNRRQRQKDFLWHKQRGKCHWCGCQMQKDWQHRDRVSPPKDLATLDHLDDRYSPMRGKYGYGNWRKVLACWLCNWKRGQESQRQVPIAELHRRAQRTSSIDVAMQSPHIGD